MPQADLPIYRGVPLCFSIIVAVLSFGDTGSFPYTVVFHLLLSACNTNWSTENLFHLSRNNRLRLMCKRSTFCTRWLSQNSKWSLFPVTIWKLVKTNSGRVYFQVFHPAAFHIMDKAKRTSRIMHGVFLFLAVYNTIFTSLYSFKIMKDWINHEECTVVCEDSYAVEDINLRQALWWM